MLDVAGLPSAGVLSVDVSLITAVAALAQLRGLQTQGKQTETQPLVDARKGPAGPCGCARPMMTSITQRQSLALSARALNRQVRSAGDGRARRDGGAVPPRHGSEPHMPTAANALWSCDGNGGLKGSLSTAAAAQSRWRSFPPMHRTPLRHGRFAEGRTARRARAMPTAAPALMHGRGTRARGCSRSVRQWRFSVPRQAVAAAAHGSLQRKQDGARG